MASPVFRLGFFLFCTLFFVGYAKKSFVVDYDNDIFLKDGRPFRYISGTVHYFQIPKDLWRDRLVRARAMGINVVQTYVEWSKHEPFKGQYSFDGDSNITEFLSIAWNLSLPVILRIGPYIDAEQDFGGLPYWLLKYPNISLRSSSDERFLTAVANWLAVLLPKVTPLLYSNGGPVIMVQVENEYGSFGCDKNYTMLMQALTMKYLQDEVVYFTTDGYETDHIQCGFLPGTLTTIDFGIMNESTVAGAFGNLRKYMPSGPMVNSEFYPGWFDLWGAKNHSQVATALVTDTMRYMWRLNASFNIYPVHGGTNWGYQAGGECPPYKSTTTSYDFDAPISESGDITAKFLDMRSTIEELTGQKVKFPLPLNSTKLNYGRVLVQYLGTVFDMLYSVTSLESARKTLYPVTMEDIDLPFGFALYETRLTNAGRWLTIGDVRDRAYVFIDYQLIKVIQRGTAGTLRVPSETTAGSMVHVLVENQGRVAYGSCLVDRKGLLSNVTLDNEILTNWTTYPLKLESLFGTDNEKIPLKKYFTKHQRRVKESAKYVPSFYLGYFMADTVGDTFANMTGWGKGQLIINGVNIGRYWPTAGPQMSLYVPAPYLTEFNQVVIFELDKPGNCESRFECYLNFAEAPIYKNNQQ